MALRNANTVSPVSLNTYQLLLVRSIHVIYHYDLISIRYQFVSHSDIVLPQEDFLRRYFDIQSDNPCRLQQFPLYVLNSVFNTLAPLFYAALKHFSQWYLTAVYKIELFFSVYKRYFLLYTIFYNQI